MPSRPMHLDRGRAMSFGAVARQYDRARPSYPAAVLDAVVPAGGCRALDVGCGTGIVARLLEARGCEVLGLEPDPRMAEVAREHGLAIEVAPLEAWDPAGRTFDLVTSGQAWHWVDPDVGAARARAVLVPGGRIAVFWNRGRHRPEIRAAFDAVYADLAPDLERYSIVLGNSVDNRFDVAAASLSRAGFRYVSVTPYPWTMAYSTDEWLEHLKTHSDHRGLGPEVLDALLARIGAVIEGFGGEFSMDYDTWLVSGVM